MQARSVDNASAYRGDTLALRIKSIGEAAQLRISALVNAGG
jgi:hypothetical protein